MQDTWVRPLGWEDPLEKEMAAHFSILAWKIPWTQSLVGYCPWGRKESETTERLHFHSLYSSTIYGNIFFPSIESLGNCIFLGDVKQDLDTH